ncbi:MULTISPECIES: precorrin-3B C(17)-methyltransferase [Rhodococcus]|jgi:precorrin-2 C20-methyltransferase/precorrin-3B C17-methyltransferase|uniref:Precorrin-3B C(17)-methyltransferase n=1 Tax=Rhodococcus erythropolis TaxID=1833 RepID=A0AAX3UXS8_RHOER|nr:MULTISPECIES: precorrin-3B C(17)-methyltransferase [Rhodococcus]ALU70948.1 ATP-binding protein [Rhodococcus erythropolis R138]MBP2523069.1 precorrin-2 C20-methyltransferase/precorrin-3B C17-methyltransferase [Rhodococcus sp. PvP104]MCS4256591.1 precorrin-2 C20-methyltransferase/precorrin-3B C17-methyltransferase [Rhodococcus erythropolis]MCW2430718.1 precorrin-2 C20-methyltransferase/precorrin-3B C17-methyltransferase [Rhodococcus erythropolis]MDA3631436.1 precorrin-3B C(17)-methyltransfera
MSAGKLWGVGIGPGDPELVTVKAARVIGEADVVAFHSARHGKSISRGVAAPYMREGQIEEHLVYPVTTETVDHPGGYQGAMDEFYEAAAERLAVHLAAGRTVALLAAGDPLFYSSYMHMHKRLADRFDAEVIPGVTSVSAASAALGKPLVEGEEILTILPGTLPQAELTRRLKETDAAAILKLGRTFPPVLQSLEDSGRLDEAHYVERASTTRQRVESAAEVDPDGVPYFSIAIVPSPSNNPRPATESRGEVVVVGLGPGDTAWTTPEVAHELSLATDLVGYGPYVDRVPTRPGQRRHSSDNRVEAERAAMALDLAKNGARVAVVSSGDPGVFAMAAAVLEVAAEDQWRGVPVRILPGMTAANAVASRVGAPLGHDYAVLSLSDRLKPWDVVARRISAVAAADMAFAVYNPASKSRTWQVQAMKDLVLEHRSPETPVVIGRDVAGAEESVRVVTLGELEPSEIDMRTLLIVGSSMTTVVETGSGRQVFTPRRYPE